ncbi:MAG TPA: hypothetical protein VF046_11235 [Gemmatimonadales bacterium]
MYRIELAPGEVTVFRTIEELATGVRNGVISPRARIFHAATDKWLPIEFHPHYKKVLETPAGQPVEPPPARRTPEPAPAAAAAEEVRGEPEIGPTAVATASPVLQLPKISYPEVARADEPAPEPTPKSGGAPRRPLHLATLALVLAAGGYPVVSAFAPAPSTQGPMQATVVERPVLPRPTAARIDSTRAGFASPPAAHPAVARTDPRPMPPASSGFAPALEARAIASGPMPTRDSTPAAAAAPAVAPAPRPELESAPAVDVTLPDLGTDSISAVARQRDSTHMRQILRAVGSTEAPAP